MKSLQRTEKNLIPFIYFCTGKSVNQEDIPKTFFTFTLALALALAKVKGICTLYPSICILKKKSLRQSQSFSSSSPLLHFSFGKTALQAQVFCVVSG